MAPKALPSPEVLRQLLRYEPDTGKLFWLPRDESDHPHARQWNARLAGKEAFTSVDAHGYRRGCIFNSNYAGHRVAWSVHTGEVPPEQIDHDNRDRSDNRWTNLRAATQSSNMRNKRMARTNTSGHTGVSWSKAAGAWIATIGDLGLQKHLGCFPTKAAALCARRAAESDLSYHPCHGLSQ